MIVRARNQREGAADPLSLMRHGHALQLRFCHALERIAEGLPNNVNPGLVRSALELLRSGLLEHARGQEQALFKALTANIASTRHLRFIIDRLQTERADDWCDVLEIAEELRTLADRPGSDPEMVGFMLRDYFEAQRRHVAWEAQVFLPLVRELLTATDLSELQRALFASRASTFLSQ